MPIITPAQFREHYPQLTGTGEDVAIAVLIERADQILASHCGFPVRDDGELTLQSGTYTERLHGPLGDDPMRLTLRMAPVSVTSIHESADWVWDSSTLIASADYELSDQYLDKLPSVGAWGSSRRRYQAVYVAGYAVAPDWLVAAVALQVRHLWDMRASQGVQTYTIGGATEAKASLTLIPPTVRRAISRARLVSARIG